MPRGRLCEGYLLLASIGEIERVGGIRAAYSQMISHDWSHYTDRSRPAAGGIMRL
jgi:hypothetical protein